MPLLKDEDPGKRLWQGTVGGGIALSAAATVAIVLLAALACIAGDPLLPRVATDSLHFSPL
jgi:hypothetical protein